MSEQQQLEAKNETITVTGIREPGCMIKLEIDVTPEGTKAAFAKALKTIKKEVSIPGFRKGRAPDAIILDRYPSHVEDEWKDILANTAFNDALQLTQLYPFGKEGVKKVKVNKSSKEEGSNISIEFEAFPSIPKIEFETLELKKVEETPIEEKDIDKTIEDIRLHHAEWTEVTDRSAEEDDYVDVKIDAPEEEPKKVICEDTRFQVKEGIMGDWMRKLITGLKKGESAEGMSEKDPESKTEDFKPTLCKITVNGIHTPELPELDDELAKKVGAESVANLRKKVTEDLKQRAANEIQAELRQQIEQFLLERYAFDLPLSVVSQEAKTRLEMELAHLRKNQVSEEEITTKREELQDRAKRGAVESLIVDFLVQAIARDHAITVSKEDVMQAMIREMYTNPFPQDADFNMIRENMEYALLRTRVKDFLVEKAKLI